MLLLAIDTVAQFVGPPALVADGGERLPRNGFAEVSPEGLALVLIHLMDKEEHLDIRLDTEVAPDPGEGIEGEGVVAMEIDRHDIAVVLDRLSDERLLPLVVLNRHPVELEAGADPSREHDDLSVALHELFDGESILAALHPAAHAYRDDQRAEWREQIEQFVDDELHLAEAGADHRPERDAVLSAERVVAHEDILPVLEPFEAKGLDGRAEVLHGSVGEFEAGASLVVLQHLIHPVLVDDLLEQPYCPARNFLTSRHLIRQHLFDVDQRKRTHHTKKNIRPYDRAEPCVPLLSPSDAGQR